MANLAEEYGTDVEFYVKPLTTTIHADTPTGAPAALHDLLEQHGLQRHEYPSARRSTSGLPCPTTSPWTSKDAWRAAPSLPCTWPATRSTALPTSSTKPPSGRPRTRPASARPTLFGAEPGAGPFLLAPRTGPARPVGPSGRPRRPAGAARPDPLDFRSNP